MDQGGHMSLNANCPYFGCPSTSNARSRAAFAGRRLTPNIFPSEVSSISSRRLAVIFLVRTAAIIRSAAARCFLGLGPERFDEVVFVGIFKRPAMSANKRSVLVKRKIDGLHRIG